MESLEMYRVWRVCPHFDRVAEFRELWPRDDLGGMWSQMTVTAEAMLDGVVPIPERFIENMYGGDSPLSPSVLKRTLEYIVASELKTPPNPELLTAWLVDGVLRWHPQKSMPTYMEPRVTVNEVAECAAECVREQRWPTQIQPHALYPTHEVLVLREQITARKVQRFIHENKMVDEVKRLLEMVDALAEGCG